MLWRAPFALTAANRTANTMRLFFALWPSPDAAERLASIAAETAARAGGRPTRQETLHLTMALLAKLPMNTSLACSFWREIHPSVPSNCASTKWATGATTG